MPGPNDSPRPDYKAAIVHAEKTAGDRRTERSGSVLYQYPDYDTYHRVQSEGNKAKLQGQFVNKAHIFALAERLNAEYGPVSFGLCHGVRRGREQGWFRRRLPRGAQVIGTEISDTATQFPATVQWDFHDRNPEWDGRADFVYTNSWDHAFDPERALQAWHASLRPGGWLLLDHTRGHEPTSASALDPFGATWDGLAATVDAALGGLVEALTSLDRLSDPNYSARVMVLRKTG